MGEQAEAVGGLIEAREAINCMSATGELLITPQARWVCPPGGAWQDLRERHAVRRILERLTERRREAPGRGLSLPELREAGWPGERMLPEAASNRIYVAMTQLRKLGLKGWLKRSEEGYFLDPALPVAEVSGEPLGASTVAVRRRAGA